MNYIQDRATRRIDEAIASVISARKSAMRAATTAPQKAAIAEAYAYAIAGLRGMGKAAQRHVASSDDEPMDPHRQPDLDEVRWLIAQGEHPEHIAAQIGSSCGAIEARARRAGDVELATPFAAARDVGRWKRAAQVRQASAG